VKISAMVLVGKHEPYLEYCLKSIEPIVNEIIMVTPTGLNPMSLDKTLNIKTDYNILKQKGKEVNFAKWRNQCLDNVNGDWIWFADADEIVAHSDGTQPTRQEIKGLIKKHPDAQNFLFLTLHFMWNYYTLDASGTNDHIHNCMRLFKNDGRRFQGKVHEYIEMDESRTFLTNNPMIWHFGHCKGVENLANRYRERHIPDNPYTGKMSKEQLSAYLKTHNKLRGRLATVRYDGPLPRVMNLW